MRKIEIDWREAFENLPSVVPAFEFRRRGDKWESPYSFDGTRSDRPDRTAAQLIRNGIILYSNGSGGNIRLETYLMEYEGVPNWVEALKRISGEENEAYSRCSKSPKPIPQNYQPAKKFRAHPQGLRQLSESSLGTAYLQQRGLLPDNLRGFDFGKLHGLSCATMPFRGCKPALRGNPCIACKWTGADGKEGGYMCIVPTYDEDYNLTGKAEKPWLTGNGSKQTGTTGGAIRLAPMIDGRIAICEGVEDALALMIMNGHGKELAGLECKKHGLPSPFAGIPVWATASCANLGAFVPPAGTREVWICVDNDKAGLAASWQLQERLKHMNIVSRALCTSSTGADFNKILLNHRVSRAH